MDLSWNRERAVTGYLDALAGMRDLAASLTPEQWTLPTELPGWSVHDVVAHVSAIEDELAGRPVPPMTVEWSKRPHVRTPMQQYTEVGVEYRRPWPPSDVVEELTRLVEERRATIEQLPDDPDAELRGPAGLAGTVQRVVGIRTFDIWAHEDDVRRAVGAPSRLDSPAAMVSVQRIVQAMPIVLAREVEAPVGTTVRWDIGAPVDDSVLVSVVADRRGEIVDDAGRVDAVVGCDVETLVLLACGRRRPDDLDISLSGDGELGHHLMHAMAITP